MTPLDLAMSKNCWNDQIVQILRTAKEEYDAQVSFLCIDSMGRVVRIHPQLSFHSMSGELNGKILTH